jgi:hypothetical protein
MTTAPLEPASLPPFSNELGRCPRCASRGPIRVHFDRDYTDARGDHFHRVCPYGCNSMRCLDRCLLVRLRQPSAAMNQHGANLPVLPADPPQVIYSPQRTDQLPQLPGGRLEE